ncbi:MAG: hypothetical protein MUF79_07590 [Burkholderiales bacterium]|nr:hypothetical protein [Burkholderiales bacterium]
MKKLLAAVFVAATLGIVSGCASVYGGMIGAGIGGLAGDTTSGMLIGAGVGGMIDLMDD